MQLEPRFSFSALPLKIDEVQESETSLNHFHAFEAHLNPAIIMEPVVDVSALCPTCSLIC
jgi:hypothetical protein